jgi:hypothetical protein
VHLDACLPRAAKVKFRVTHFTRWVVQVVWNDLDFHRLYPPSRAVNSERRSFALLRPIMDPDAQNRVRDLIIAAWNEHQENEQFDGGVRAALR